MLGLSVVAVGIGAAAGTRYGGVYGGIAGALFAGSALNIYRAFHYYKLGSESDDKEARVSGTYAVVSGILGAVLWTKFGNKPQLTPNPKDDCSDVRVANPCNIRRVGP
jgi:chromate transport protein ChrA